MDCKQTRELLSAYYDNELALEVRTAVSEHLGTCPACAGDVEQFRRLSTFAQSLAELQPASSNWDQLEQLLEAAPRVKTRHRGIGSWFIWLKSPSVQLGLGIAALLFLAIGLGGYQTWHRYAATDQMAAVFGQYLDAFHHDPTAAQRVLLANYPGEALSSDHALQQVGYVPAVARGVPRGYAIDKSYVMKMPCCTCVQCVCRRDDGTTLVIFEHDDREPIGFGARPTTEAHCQGTPCSLVALDHSLAATWQSGSRHITVVGLRDAAELDRMVAWFEEKRPAIQSSNGE